MGSRSFRLSVVPVLVLLGSIVLTDAVPAQCQVDRFAASDGQPHDGFGNRMAVNGERVVIGVPLDTHGLGSEAGSVYVFHRDDQGTPSDASDDAWVEIEKLRASDPGDDDQFGRAVALSGDRILVGAPFHDHAGPNSGAAYLYRLDDGGTPLDPSDDEWLFESELLAPDPAPGDWFGTSLALQDDFAYVGALNGHLGAIESGTVHVYRRDDGGTPAEPGDDTWIEHVEIGPSHALDFQQFGHSIAVAGDRLLVGSPTDPAAGFEAGSAYVFERDDGGTPGTLADDTWIERHKLTSSDGDAFDQFGYAVSLRGDEALVSAIWHNDPPTTFGGAAYVMRLDDNGTPGIPGDDVWVQQAELAPGFGSSANFGISVAFDGAHALVGAHRDDEVFTNMGAAGLYRRDDGGTPGVPSDDGWSLQQMLRPADGGTDDHFGISVGLDGDAALVGASGGFLSGGNPGTVYGYALVIEPWADLGEALPGSGLSPCLHGTGTLAGGVPVTLGLHDGLEDTAATLVVGFGILGAPFKGGTLVPSLDVVLSGLATDGDGELSLAATWPAGLPSGLETVFQFWLVDPSGPAGFAASNALSGTTP